MHSSKAEYEDSKYYSPMQEQRKEKGKSNKQSETDADYFNFDFSEKR